MDKLGARVRLSIIPYNIMDMMKMVHTIIINEDTRVMPIHKEK